MANSIILALFSLLAIVLSFFLSTTAVPMHAASPNDVVSTICQRTRNPSFCSNVLKSAGTTDLKLLATFTLNLAHTRAAKSRLLAQSLASKATDSKLKERYDDAKNYLGFGDYNGVNIKASGAMTEAEDCLENFTQPPVDVSALSNNGKALEDVCSIVLVISNLLLGRV